MGVCACASEGLRKKNGSARCPVPELAQAVPATGDTTSLMLDYF